MSNTTNEQDRKEFSFEENFIDETIIADKSSKTKEFIKKFMKRKTAVAGFIVIVFLVFLAIFGQYLAPYDPDAYDYSNMLAGPSAAYLFGTDHYGRDILSRLLAGTRLTLGVSFRRTFQFPGHPACHRHRSSSGPWYHQRVYRRYGLHRAQLRPYHAKCHPGRQRFPLCRSCPESGL